MTSFGPEQPGGAARRGRDAAVIGMACRFPDANHYEELWRNLAAGLNAVTEIPSSRWDVSRWYSADISAPNRSTSRWGAFVRDFDRFDHAFFHVSPREARNMDPQQRLLLEETWHCIEDAGVSVETLARARTSVYVGAMAMDHYQTAYASGVETEGHACAGTYACMLANRVSYHFGLSGESITLDTACSSSLVALHQARRALLLGEADFCLVAGVSLDFSPWKYVSFGKSRMLSPTGQCRTFDKDADGYVPGEGIGVLLLRRLEDAERDGSAIHGVVRGSAVNHVGRAASLTAPRVEAQREVLLEAYRDAAISPSTLTYVEAHGTGTSLGDPVEVSALTEAFRASTDRRSFCAIGSIKTNIGHLEAAAGVAGVIKTLLMMRHEQLAPTLNLKTPNPLIDFERSPFVPARAAQPWVRPEGLPLRAGVSSFGFGGVNSHVVLEEYRADTGGTAGGTPSGSPHAFVLSARTESSLRALKARWASRARSPDFEDSALRDACLTLQEQGQSFKWRFGAVVRSPAELEAVLAREDGPSRGDATARPAFVFGELQETGAALGSASDDPLFAAAFARLAAPLVERAGCASATELLSLGDALPVALRPALAFCVQCAMAEGLQQRGVSPRRVEGVGPGLPAALSVSGALSPDDVLRALLPGSEGAFLSLVRPRVPTCHPVSGQDLPPWRADAAILRALVSDFQVEPDAVREAATAARLLFGSQHTFSRHLEEWRRPLDTVGRQLESLLAGPAPGDERIAALVLAVSHLRLDRKWSLGGVTPPGDAKLAELAALVSDERLLPDEAVRLVCSPDDEAFETVAQALADRLNQALASGPCSAASGPGTPLPGAEARLHATELLGARGARDEVSSLGDGLVLSLGRPPRSLDGAGFVVPLESPSLAATLEALISLWREGLDVSWPRHASELPHRRFRLPGYVFDGTRFPPPLPSDPLMHSAPEGAPSPGGGTAIASTLPQPGTGHWRVDEPIIADHRITGFRLAPGAELVRLAFLATRQRSPRVDTLSGVSFHTPAIVDGDLAYAVDADPTGRFVVRAGDKALCTGSFGESAPSRTATEHPAAPLVDSGSGADLYARLASVGYGYGESLQVLRGVGRANGRFVARLEGGKGTTADTVDAAMLDGVLQCAVARALLEGQLDGSSLLIPFFIQRLRASGSLAGPLTVEVSDPGVGARSGDLQVDLLARDARGGLVLELEGVVFRRVPSGFLAAGAAPSLKKLEGTEVYAPRWVTTATPAVADLRGASLLLLPPQVRGEPLARELAGNGPVIIARASKEATSGELEFDPEDEAGWTRLLRRVAEEPGALDGPLSIYFLLAADTAPATDAADLWRYQAQGVRALFFLAKAAGASRFKSARLAIGVRDTFAVVAGDTARGHAAAGLAGTARTLALEYKKIRPVVVDIEPRGVDDLSLVKRMRAEVLASGPAEHVVAWRNERRFAPRVVPASRGRGDLPYRDAGVYLIVGGAGGLGRKTAAHIARRVRGAKLALVGRSPASAQTEQVLRELELLGEGTQARYFSTDVTDPTELASTLARVKESFGPLHGVIHSGGVLADKLIFSKDAESFDRVLRPKVLGAWLLDALTATEPLDFFAVYSSVVSEVGNIGQVDYASANAFLDAFMDFRRTQRRPGRSLAINWTLWADGGMGRDLRAIEQLAARGITLLEDGPGFAALDAALTGPEARVIVLGPGAGHPFGERLVSGEAPPVVAPPQAPEKPRKQAAPAQLETWLTELIASRIEADATSVDREESFFALGVESVMVKDIMKELDGAYDGLSPTLLFERPNIRELATFLEARPRRQGAPMPEASPVPTAEVAPSAQPPSVATPTRAPSAPTAGMSPFARPPSAVSPTRASSAPSTGTPPPAQQPSATPLTREQRTVTPGAERAIAIVGMSGRFPQAPDLETYWSNLLAGRDCITEIPSSRWDARRYHHPDPTHPDTTYGRWGGFIEDVDKFDPFFFNISVREAEQMDPQQRLFLETAYAAMEHAGYGNRKLVRDAKVGLFVGVMWNEHSVIAAEQGTFKGRYAGPGSMYWAIANRVSYFLDLTGPSIAVDTACSSSLTAVHLACRSILDGECSMAIAGGVNLSLHPEKYLYLGQTRFLSTDGRCRSFGEGGTGYVPGEGVGAVLLKPLDQALADGDTVYAVIRGTSVNHGGRAGGFTVPNPTQQAQLVEDAFARSGVSPDQLGYVECHGTGTSLGDPIELQGLTQAFLRRGSSNARASCAIGSAKSSIGHLEAAAGIAGLIKATLCLERGKIPPNLHSQVKNPNLDFASGPFFVVESPMDFQARDGSRFAGLSSFGAGGSNAHAILQWSSDWETGPSADDGRPELFTLSAATSAQLERMAQRLIDALTAEHTARYGLRDIAGTLALGRAELAERLAIVASSRSELLGRLRAFVQTSGKVAGVARGSTRERREALTGGGEDPSFLAGLTAKRDLATLAGLWVRGITIDLGALYATTSWRRVALPTYPFERRRCWIPTAEPAASAPTAPRVSVLHPLVHTNVSTLREQRFATALTGEEFFLAHHVVGGKKLLPAVACIEAARAAVELSGESAVTLRDLVWMRPIVAEEDGCRFQLRLKPGEHDLEFSLVEPGDANEVVYARGRIPRGAAVVNTVSPVVDLAALRARATERLDREDYYARFRTRGFEYGPAFQAIVEGFRAGTEGLARLELPAVAASPALQLHPSLLDGALQTALLLIDEEGGSRQPPLPFSMGTVELLRTPSGTCWAWVRRKEALRFDVTLVDDAGRALVVMRDFSLRRPQEGSRPAVTPPRPRPEPSPRAAAPRNTASARERVESQLLSVYADLLKVAVHELDPEVPVSNYGVESVMMMTVLSRVEALFGRAVEPNAIVEHPAIRDFASYLFDEGVVKEEEVSAPEVAPPPPFVVEVERAPEPIIVAPASPAPRVLVASAETTGGRPPRVAVIAMSARQPLSENLEAFWRNLTAGRSLTREVPAERLADFKAGGSLPDDLRHIRHGAFVDGVDLFDASAFGVSDHDALLMDPQQRILLELSRELFDAAGYRSEELLGRRVSVFIGGAESAYLRRHRAHVPDEAAGRMVVSTIQNMLAARISDHYGLTGWSQTVDTACSSSLVAIHQACRSIVAGDSEMAVAGGVELILDPFYFTGFARAGVLTDGPHTRVFDERASGFVLGEGAGLVLLKSLDAALRDGDPILALVAGSAVNNDGKTMGLTTPSQERQTELIRLALTASGLEPTDITYLEAHGTGTLLGDPIEVRAATKAFGRGAEPWCALGSVKSNVGHSLHAAGVTAFLKTALAVERGLLPATLNCERPHPRFRFEESPFRPITRTAPWNPASGVRRAGISSFGFGGTNCHVVLEQFIRKGAPQLRNPLPATRFQRRSYWLGRQVVEQPKPPPLSRHELLLRLSRGELTPDRAVALGRPARTTD